MVRGKSAFATGPGLPRAPMMKASTLMNIIDNNGVIDAEEIIEKPMKITNLNKANVKFSSEETETII